MKNTILVINDTNPFEEFLEKAGIAYVAKEATLNLLVCLGELSVFNEERQEIVTAKLNEIVSDGHSYYYIEEGYNISVYHADKLVAKGEYDPDFETFYAVFGDECYDYPDLYRMNADHNASHLAFLSRD